MPQRNVLDGPSLAGPLESLADHCDRRDDSPPFDFRENLY